MFSMSQTLATIPHCIVNGTSRDKNLWRWKKDGKKKKLNSWKWRWDGGVLLRTRMGIIILTELIFQNTEVKTEGWRKPSKKYEVYQIEEKTALIKAKLGINSKGNYVILKTQNNPVSKPKHKNKNKNKKQRNRQLLKNLKEQLHHNM